MQTSGGFRPLGPSLYRSKSVICRASSYIETANKGDDYRGEETTGLGSSRLISNFQFRDLGGSRSLTERISAELHNLNNASESNALKTITKASPQENSYITTTVKRELSPLKEQSEDCVTSRSDVSESDCEKDEKPQYGGVRVRSEEEMKLREFVLLDEVGPNEGDEFEGDANGFPDDHDDDLSDTEIDAMLEEAVEPAKKKPRKENDSESKVNINEEEGYVENEKIIMVEKVKDHFEVLPDGWVQLTHNSGMPLYLHRSSRVCTLSKPYFLGPGSARKHAIPLSAIPCLDYKLAKEEEKKKNEKNEKSNTLIINGTEIPSARVETVQETEQRRQLSPLQFREYCEKLFEFQPIKVIRFKSWSIVGVWIACLAGYQFYLLVVGNRKTLLKKGKVSGQNWADEKLARRKFTKERNANVQRPMLPKDTKLITCPIKTSTIDGKTGRVQEWIMNPNGKSYVCILHEYIQRALKDQPVYSFKELENTATPYLATVSIGNVQYGTGYGSSKKQAKHDAAKATLEILIPDMKFKIDQDEKGSGRAGSRSGQTDLSFFDGIKIDDPRVTELCVKTTEPLPHAILLTCLQRNFGLGEMNIKYETMRLKHSKNEFTMTVGNHRATVVCQNKRDGKQKAAQAILKALHPHIPSWGSLLRLYGNTSVKTMKEKKIEEQEITLLQSKGTSHSPNYAILNKLKEEMKKFKAIKSAIKPIGTFIPPDDVELPTESSSELKNVVI